MHLKKLFLKQMKKLGYKYQFKEIDKKLSKKIYNKKNVINIIDVKFKFVKKLLIKLLINQINI